MFNVNVDQNNRHEVDDMNSLSDVRETKVTWSGLDTFIVLFVWFILSTDTVFNSAGRVLEPLGFAPLIAEYIGAVAIHLIQFLIVGIVIFSKHHLSWKDFGFRPLTKKSAVQLILWSIIGIVLNGLVLSLTALIWSGESSKADTIESTGFIFSILMVAVIAPIAEEVVFRGVVYKYFRMRFGMVAGIMMNGVLFGLNHAPSWELVMNAAVMGAFFAYIYERSGTLWTPIIVHGLTNAAVTTLFFLIIGLGN